jgi:U4/U6 small nuclear ribonucleoprotein PRP3
MQPQNTQALAAASIIITSVLESSSKYLYYSFFIGDLLFAVFTHLFPFRKMSAVDQTTTGLNCGGNGGQQDRDEKNAAKLERKRKRRWGDAPKNDAAAATAVPPAPTGPVDSKAKALALKASVAARLAALKAKTGGGATAATTTVSSLKRPPPSTEASTATAPQQTPRPTKRAKHYELDMSVTGPTFHKHELPKPKINPYLAHRVEKEEAKSEPNNDSQTAAAAAAEMQRASADDYIDDRLEQFAAPPTRRRKDLRFVQPGTFTEIAERKRQRALNAESAGFVSGRKVGQFVQSAGIGGGTTISSTSYYGTTDILDSVADLGVLPPRVEAEENKKASTTMPLVVEWWDMELLPSKLKKQVAAFEGKALSKETQSQMQQLSTKTDTKVDDEEAKPSSREANEDKDLPQATRTMISSEAQELRNKCVEKASLSYSKTAELIQHIVPIQPPHAKKDEAVEPVLHLTKKERKRQRKLRREAKQQEQQDLQAAGLIPSPEPRLTLQNFIRVLGDQAYVDPSQMEQKVMEQMQARQRAHLERNEARKLTKEQKAAKLRRKYEEDTSTTGVHVALFYVRNVAHPYHRTKLDLNAQQYGITGGVVECETPQVACVICEGGPKAIKKFTRLMTVRMKWTGPDNEDDEEEDDAAEVEDGAPKKHKFDKENKCELVWTGMATRRFFKGFVFQAFESSDQAKKILKSKGVGHYWDQVLAQASGRSESLHLKLADSDDEDDDNSYQGKSEDEDIVMQDS